MTTKMDEKSTIVRRMMTTKMMRMRSLLMELMVSRRVMILILP